MGRTEPEGASRAGQPANVLVAEDDEDMRQILVEALRAEGYDVTELSDGGELLVHLAGHYRLSNPIAPPDLIVSDIRMPVVSGLAILRGLRDAHWATPVILITAFGDSKTHREAEALGAVVLDKPLRVRDILELARRVLCAR